MEILNSQEPEDLTMPRDLRVELFQDLSDQFAAALNSDESLPSPAREALAELLDSDAPTAAEIIAAASKDEYVEEDVTDE